MWSNMVITYYLSPFTEKYLQNYGNIEVLEFIVDINGINYSFYMFYPLLILYISIQIA